MQELLFGFVKASMTESKIVARLEGRFCGES